MDKRSSLIVVRFFLALLSLAAVVTQLTVQIEVLHGSVVNFFSFFTILSNIFFALVLLAGVYLLIARRDPTPRDDLIRGAAVLCMVIVGIVFSALLRNTDLGGLLPWVNAVHHYIMPIYALVDWLVVPPRSKLSLRQLPYWLIFPFLYLVYSLIRGPFARFYPYPFLNPNSPTTGGYGGVALYCIAIFVAFLVFGWLVMLIGNRMPRAALA